MSAPTDVPAFLQLQAPQTGIRARVQSAVAQVQGAVSQAQTAITWSVGLSIAAIVLSTGTIIYVAANRPRLG